MAKNDLHPNFVAFECSLDRLEQLLSKHGADLWAHKVRQVRKVALKSDAYSAEMLLGLFGGMGSLNDLIINAPKSENDKLRAELSTAYNSAKASALPKGI